MYAVAISRGSGDIMHFSMEFAVADWTSIWHLLYEFEQTYFHPEKELKQPGITFRDYLVGSHIKSSAVGAGSFATENIGLSGSTPFRKPRSCW